MPRWFEDAESDIRLSAEKAEKRDTKKSSRTGRDSSGKVPMPEQDHDSVRE